MAETSQAGMSDPVHPRQPPSLIRMERMECPLLKAQAFALLWWIAKTNMSAVC
jgi:hypothetical protein